MKNIFKVIFFASVFTVGSSHALAISTKWFEPTEISLTNSHLSEVLLYLSKVGQVVIDSDPNIGGINVEVISIKGKSPAQLLASLVDMYDLKITETSKGGIRVSALDKGHLQKLTINPAHADIEVSYNGVPSDAVLQNVAQLANLNMILPRLPHGYTQSFQGKYAPFAIINDIAEMEGLNVIERDGLIYFKLPKN